MWEFTVYRFTLGFAAIVFCCPAETRGEETAPRFDAQVAPILIQRCLECHSGPAAEGALDLSTRQSALAGGESGAALAAGRPDASLLWQRVEQDEMPPEQPLSAEEKAVLRAWIATGLQWDTERLDPFRYTTEKRAGYDWWALQPLGNRSSPRHAGHNPIDGFVRATLAESGLNPSATADRRTLLRRLKIDLVGLPPTPAEVAAFEADVQPGAYERLVERLLSSPEYGIRWARHWLDVARFGESQGFERDKIRENSWPYRDWVIEALNAGMPYDEFVRAQVAGDVLHPTNGNAIIATGFLVAGPYDEVGQNQQSAVMKAVVRQDELEDLVALVGQSFLGLTVNCARCHDHKFDPISQREYYQLAAALGGVRHGSRKIPMPADEARTAEINRKIHALEQQIREMDRKLSERVTAATDGTAPPLPLARWSFDEDLKDVGGLLEGHNAGGAKLSGGRLIVSGKNNSYVMTEPLTTDLRAKTLEVWVQLDDLRQRGGAAISVQTLDGKEFDAIVFGEREPNRWAAGSDSFRRTKTFDGPLEKTAGDELVHIAVVYYSNGYIGAYRNGKRYGRMYRSSSPITFAAGNAQIVFGLRHSPAGGNRMLRGAIEAASLYDRALSPEEVARSAAATANDGLEARLAALTAPERQKRAELRAQISALRESLPPVFTSYAVTPRDPEVAHVLLRGNPASPGDSVSAGGIASLQGVDPDFGLEPEASDIDRRRELVEWICSPQNPLFSRVIANRLWHHHFGVGLVETPNDFGYNGGRPSHPELLDFLARFLIDSGWDLKSLHRLIVTSSTYRQASRYRESAAGTDAENRLLWRKSPTRLEAEALRDAILAVSGELNARMGGPGYRDFETFTRNTQFYVMQDPIGAEFNRRSIYRTWIRSGRNPFLDVFDCPDPSTKTPRRVVTVTPIQALALLNNSFVLRMSDRFAERIRKAVGKDVGEQVCKTFQLAYAREPNDEELRDATDFVTEHGLPELCRVVFNSSEFLYVD